MGNEKGDLSEIPISNCDRFKGRGDPSNPAKEFAPEDDFFEYYCFGEVDWTGYIYI